MLNFIEVNIWATTVGPRNNIDPGHASLSLRLMVDGKEDYLSFWPAERGSIMRPVRAVLNTYEGDIGAEQREPDGQYRLEVTKKEGALIAKKIKEIKDNVGGTKPKFRYSFQNLGPEKNAFNCSGLVEHVISTSVVRQGIDFGEVSSSTPNRVALILHKLKETDIIKEKAVLIKALSELESVYAETPRARL